MANPKRCMSPHDIVTSFVERHRLLTASVAATATDPDTKGPAGAALLCDSGQHYHGSLSQLLHGRGDGQMNLVGNTGNIRGDRQVILGGSELATLGE